MIKQELITKLKSILNDIEKDKDDIEYNVDISIIEKPKCPKCGTYEGKGYTYSNFLYSISECTVCGYHKEEL